MEDELDVGIEESELDTSSADEPEVAEPEAKDDEPFLAVSDRTRYKTREDALKGFQEKDRLIADYSRFGRPDELQKRLAQLEVLEKMGFKPGRQGAEEGDDMDDILSDVEDERQRDAYKALLSRVDKLADRKFKKMLEQEGIVKRDELPQLLSVREQEAQAFNTIRESLTGDLKAKGMKVGPGFFEAAEQYLINVAGNQNHPLSRNVNELWTNGDYKGLAKLYLESQGLDVERADSPDPQRTEYAERKEATKRLPKPPSKGANASAEAESEEEARARRRTPEGRREMARDIEKRWLQRRGAAAR